MNQRMMIRFLLFSSFLYLFSCAPTAIVKPLAKKEVAVSASLGGPLIAFAGTVIPMPLSNLGVAYGWKEKLTATASLGTTALAFGVAQVDLGLLRGFSNPNGYRPGFSGFTTQHFMLDKWKSQFRWYPEVGGHFFWDWKESKNRLYAGGAFWMETRKLTENLPNQNFLLSTWHLGYQHTAQRWMWNVEVKLIGPEKSNKDLIVTYISPGKSGTLGAYFGVCRKF